CCQILVYVMAGADLPGFDIVLRFIRTVHHSIAFSSSRGKRLSKNIADAEIHRPRASGDPGASDWPRRSRTPVPPVLSGRDQASPIPTTTIPHPLGVRCPHRYSAIMAI